MNEALLKVDAIKTIVSAEQVDVVRDNIIKHWMIKSVDMEVSIQTGNHYQPSTNGEKKWMNIFSNDFNKRKILLLAVKSFLQQLPILVTDARSILSITPSTMSRAISDLEADGYIKTGYIEEGAETGFKTIIATPICAEYYYKYSQWRFYYFKKSGMENLAQTIVGLEEFQKL